MNIDAVFLPVAEELIDSVFPTPITYIQIGQPSYDPETGLSSPIETPISINAGILSRGRSESGDAAGEYELRLWIHHGASGLQALPTTTDRVLYDNTYWKIIVVDPTYSSDSLIASKLLVRAE